MRKEIVYEDIRPPYCYHAFDDELSDEAKIVMLRIMRRINENQSVNISFLAEELGEDPFTVRSCLVGRAGTGPLEEGSLWRYHLPHREALRASNIFN
jgi:hypothetical protein